MQRNPNDTVTVLPNPHADPKSPMFVPIACARRSAPSNATTEDKLRRQLYTTNTEPWARSVNGTHHVINHRTNEADLAVGLTWLKLDTAAANVRRDTERRAAIEASRLAHTGRLCQRYDTTANNTGLSAAPGASRAVPCNASRRSKRTRPSTSTAPPSPSRRGRPTAGRPVSEIIYGDPNGPIERTTFDRWPPGHRSHRQAGHDHHRGDVLARVARAGPPRRHSGDVLMGNKTFSAARTRRAPTGCTIEIVVGALSLVSDLSGLRLAPARHSPWYASCEMI